jgi:hypothetical protein
MTEELEKKLNELLGLKKQLEEITEGKKKAFASSVVEQYKKETRLTLIRYWVAVTLGYLLVIFGLIIYVHTHDLIYIDCPTIIIAGLGLMVFAKLCWLIRKSKLSILQEIKQFELRITEVLKK